MKYKEVLVTGGAGFIGSHLCEKLVEKGCKVASLDNYFTGKEENHVKGVKYIKGHTKDINKLILDTPDIIYHLGEYSRVLTSFEDVKTVWDLNIIGTLGVLEFARENNIKIVYAGSSTKFGDSIGGKAESPYAWSKSNNTELVSSYGKWFNLPYSIAYFYNVYGGRQISLGKYATVIGIFEEKAKTKKSLTVASPGTQRRAFTHIEDIINGLVLVGEKGSGDGYCIGAEETYSILEIAKIFGGKIIMTPEKKGDRMYSTIDLSKMKELGWSAKQNVRDYINLVLKK